MDKLVLLKRNKIVTTSKLIASGTENTHGAIQKILSKFTSDFQEFGNLFTDLISEKSKGKNAKLGRPEKIYYLNEDQSALLITYLKNSKKVREFKVCLIKEFRAMKDFIEERHSSEWQDYRKESKDYNKEMNDIIKEYVEYAKSSGSGTPDNYYISFPRLVNKFTGIQDGERDLSGKKKLRNLTIIMEIVQATIQKGISEQVHYKDIYQNCKIQLQNFTKYLPVSAR